MTRRNSRRTPVEDEPEAIPTPGSALGANGPDGGDDDIRDIEMRGAPNTSRKTEELLASMKVATTGAPRFPYPPNLDDEYKPYWAELVNSFPKDHFQLSDYPNLRIYCRCAADIERITLLVREEGEVVLGGRGNLVPNPRLKIRNQAELVIMALSVKFRNQPASRVNSENDKGRIGKTAAANRASSAIQEGDGLLAGAQRH